jgi:F-type H+-transporting ATPase subunit epsilon
MQLEILTPDKTVFSGEVDSVTLPGSGGQFQVLKNHAALVSSLEKGNIKLMVNKVEQQFEIGGGVVEVLNNKIVVLV